MNLIQTPLSRLADRIGAYYASRPDLIVSLLTRLGADKIRSFRGQIRCTCPIHMGNNDEAFALWFDKGYPVWKCHTDCSDKGTLSKLLMKKYSCSFEQAVMYLANHGSIQVTGEMMTVSKQMLDEESIEAMRRRLKIINPASQEQPLYFPEQWVQWSSANLHNPSCAVMLDYLIGPMISRTSWGERKRQMSIEVVKHFQLGFVPARVWTWQEPGEDFVRGWCEDRISFPWRSNEGHLMGFAGRRVDGIPDQKYKTLPGTRRALALWWMHDPLCKQEILRTRVLHMVEGYTDVMRAYEHRAFNTTALGGTELTPRQLQLVQACCLDHVVMYLDPDGPGMVAAAKVAEQLQNTTRVLIAKPPGENDPADLLDPNEFWSPILRAKPFIPKGVRP